jgi:hypothetical protein
VSDAPRSRAIVEGLAGATRALEVGELVTAAELLVAVETACAAADASGQPLTAGELKQARALYARLQVLARNGQASLMASQLHSARARAATHVYKPES